MAQFVTHIQPTLVEASHHHMPSHLHYHHGKDYHHKDKDSKDGKKDRKDHHATRVMEFPVLPKEHPKDHHHKDHDGAGHHKDTVVDGGLYVDSHGYSHEYNLQYVDSQGITRDAQGHAIPEEEYDSHHHQHHHHQHQQHQHHDNGTKAEPPHYIDLKTTAQGDNKLQKKFNKVKEILI